MTDENTNDDLTKRELEEKKEKLEGTSWPTDHLDEKIDDVETEREKQEHLADLKMKIKEAEEKGLGDDPTIDRLRDQAKELAKELNGPDKDIDAMRERAEHLEHRVELLKGKRQTSDTERRIKMTRRQAEALREEIAEAEDQLTEALASVPGSEAAQSSDGSSKSARLETLTSSVSDPTPSSSSKSEPDRTVDVREALGQWGLSMNGLEIGEAIEDRKQRVETFEEGGWDAMAAQTRAEIEVLEAAAEGRAETEIDDAAVLANLRAKSGS